MSVPSSNAAVAKIGQKGRSWHSWCNSFRLFIQFVHSTALQVHESCPFSCVFSPHLIKLMSLAIIETWLAFCQREATWIPNLAVFSSNNIFFCVLTITFSFWEPVNHLSANTQVTVKPLAAFASTRFLYNFLQMTHTQKNVFSIYTQNSSSPTN